jgi:hypothetical protein
VNGPTWGASTGMSGEVSGLATDGCRVARPAKSPVWSTHGKPHGSDPVGAANRMRDQVIPDRGPPTPYPCWVNHARATVAVHCRTTPSTARIRQESSKASATPFAMTRRTDRPTASCSGTARS